MKFKLIACLILLGACNGAEEKSSDIQPDIISDAAGDLASDSLDDSAPDATSDTVPQSPWPGCPTAASSLALKGEGYDKACVEVHIHDNLLRTVSLKNDDSGEVQNYHHSDNANYWTGLYLAGQVFRWALNGEPKAMDNALMVAQGLHDMQGVTGIPGLLCRCYAAPDGLYGNKGEGDPQWHDSTAPGYEGWRFKGDVSKDGMTGVLFAYGVVADLVPDGKLREMAAEDAKAIAMHLINNGQKVIDVTGEITEHGDLYAASFGGFPGFNALLASAFIKVAAVLTEDPVINDYYYGCLMGRYEVENCRVNDGPVTDPYHDVIDDWLGIYLENCQENFNNFLMSFLSMYTLVRLEDDPQLSARFRQIFHSKMWQYPGHDYPASEQRNPVFTYLYAGAVAPGPEDTTAYQAIEDAACSLDRFPETKFQYSNPKGDFSLEVCKSRGGDPRAAEPLWVDERYIDNFVWRLDPYGIPKGSEGSGYHQWSPEDWILPYWLGRYHGFLSPDA
jgi:hypothetical protein